VADAAAAVAAAGIVAAFVDDADIVAAAAVVAAGPRMRTLGGTCMGGCLSMTDPPSGNERCMFLERENNITTLCCFVFFLGKNKSILVTSYDSQKKPLIRSLFWISQIKKLFLNILGIRNQNCTYEGIITKSF
jgi:hypothetical protein